MCELIISDSKLKENTRMPEFTSNQAQQLTQLIKQSILNKDQRHQAWTIMREEGFESARDYVENLPATLRIDLQDAVPYQIWGQEQIDPAAIEQMKNAARLPISVQGALMPDAHLGYGLPIGGVLATEDAVIPYAVGVDIACRMKLTVFAVDVNVLETHRDLLKTSLMEQTRFGAGAEFKEGNRSHHAVLDHPDWETTPLLKNLKTTAVKQLGSSGGGNHFVEWGVFSLDKANPTLGIDTPGDYVALLSHSGSRGVGYKIANHYSKLAQENLPGLPDNVKHLAWFEMDAELGEEYWLSMQLAGEFASANHAVIHDRIAHATGFAPLVEVENHHNFAWKEQINEQEVIVHRKGATPAGKSVLGIIPGSMGDPGYVVMGKGKDNALNSASHGAGRKMSRRQANKSISREEQANYLKKLDVELLGGGLDESPQAYKAIDEVMASQADLVDVVGKFEPKIVRMADD